MSLQEEERQKAWGFAILKKLHLQERSLCSGSSHNQPRKSTKTSVDQKSLPHAVVFETKRVGDFFVKPSIGNLSEPEHFIFIYFSGRGLHFVG